MNRELESVVAEVKRSLAHTSLLGEDPKEIERYAEAIIRCNDKANDKQVTYLRGGLIGLGAGIATASGLYAAEHFGIIGKPLTYFTEILGIMSIVAGPIIGSTVESIIDDVRYSRYEELRKDSSRNRGEKILREREK